MNGMHTVDQVPGSQLLYRHHRPVEPRLDCLAQTPLACAPCSAAVAAASLCTRPRPSSTVAAAGPPSTTSSPGGLRDRERWPAPSEGVIKGHTSGTPAHFCLPA